SPTAFASACCRARPSMRRILPPPRIKLLDALRTPPAPRPVKAPHDAAFGGYHRQLLDALDEPVLATDTRGTITYWNPAAERLLGWTAEDVMGKPSDAFFPLADELSDDRERLLNQGSRWTGVLTGSRKDRTSVQAHLSVSPIPA